MIEQFIYTIADIGNIRTYRYFLPIPASDVLKYIVYDGDSLDLIAWNGKFINSITDGCDDTIKYWIANQYVAECDFNTIMKLRES